MQIQVTITVTELHLEYAAECAFDMLYDDYDRDVFEALGISRKDTIQELMTWPPLLECIKEAVQLNGMDALESPYDYLDFEIFENTKEWRQLVKDLDWMTEALEDLEDGDECMAAIETLKRAGFKVVKT